jgi:gliding motility-associated-like protein
MKWSRIVFSLIFLLSNFILHAQYILNGAAQKVNCHCYTLTPEAFTKSGSVWNNNRIDLNNPFDYWFNVFLGCNDNNGADGIVFMLQPLSTNVGSTGEGMGFNGIQPSIGITLDTYQNFNLNDPASDHITIQSNGNIAHGSDLAGPVNISDTTNNVEDCKWHKLRISWDPSGYWLRAYFDDVLRVEKKISLLDSIFVSSPLVYWGFSAATGGSANLQQFCTALNAKFTTGLVSDTICKGTTVNFSDRSEYFAPPAAYNWDFGDGSTSSLKDPPPHIYYLPGVYEVKFILTALDGCVSDTMKKKIVVGEPPDASFTLTDACSKKPVFINFSKQNYLVSYNWKLNGADWSSVKDPPVGSLAAGSYQVSLSLSSLAGCGPVSVASDSLHIFPLPVINASIKDGCVNENVSYSSLQQDVSSLVNLWSWDFDNGMVSNSRTGNILFDRTGNYNVSTWAISNYGCSSDTIITGIRIGKALINAGPDTMIFKNQPAQLRVSGNGNFTWSPLTGLNNSTIADPVITIAADQAYKITVTTTEGCQASDSLYITIFKGSYIYPPNAFTPNGDGLNDVFRITNYGIKNITGFSVYNRWGQLMYSGTDRSAGWDGRHRGIFQPAGTYVWIFSAVDYAGRVHKLKGIVNLIR